MHNIKKSKIQHRRTQPAEFGADNIDNTAPVKKILEDLPHKNPQAFAFYCQTIRPRRSTKEHFSFHFTFTGHPLYAFPDDWEGGLNSGYFESFTYKSLMPKIITPMKNIKKSDPVTDFMKLKNVWIQDCRKLRQTVISSSIMEDYEVLNEEVVRCPKHFVDMAAHLDSDPDPYFDDSYNWYYAGNGNMQLICIDWVDYLLHSEFSTLYLTQFSTYDMGIKTDHSASFECEGDNIFETICSSHNIVTVRMKKKVIILKIVSSDEKLDFEQIKTVESELPFTSISYDSHHKNILYITTLDNKVTIVNLDRLTGRTVKLKSKVESLINNWNAVISSDRIKYIHVTRNAISVYDKRTNNISHTWDAVHEVSDYNCNNITAAKQCEGSPALYYGTDHHLFVMDIRYQKKSKPKPLLRWTHGMQCVPTYISTCNFEFNKELICLSSQWCEDICVVPNYDLMMRDGEISDVTMPYKPPSILDSLHQARQKLLCFDLYNPIDTRLSTAITGHMIIEHGENYAILMQNSLGDISCHTLYPEHMESFIEDDSIHYLNEWSNFYKQDKKEFEVSSIDDISKIWKVLKKIPENYEFISKRPMTKETYESNEKEIHDIIENEELDSGILDLWTNKSNETAEDSSFVLNLQYSDDSMNVV